MSQWNFTPARRTEHNGLCRVAVRCKNAMGTKISEIVTLEYYCLTAAMHSIFPFASTGTGSSVCGLVLNKCFHCNIRVQSLGWSSQLGPLLWPLAVVNPNDTLA